MIERMTVYLSPSGADTRVRCLKVIAALAEPSGYETMPVLAAKIKTQAQLNAAIDLHASALKAENADIAAIRAKHAPTIRTTKAYMDQCAVVDGRLKVL